MNKSLKRLRLSKGFLAIDIDRKLGFPINTTKLIELERGLPHNLDIIITFLKTQPTIANDEGIIFKGKIDLKELAIKTGMDYRTIYNHYNGNNESFTISILKAKNSDKLLNILLNIKKKSFNEEQHLNLIKELESLITELKNGKDIREELKNLAKRI